MAAEWPPRRETWWPRRVVQTGEPDPSGQSEGACRHKPEQKAVQKSEPVYMAETPDPNNLRDAEIVPPGEDRG